VEFEIARDFRGATGETFKDRYGRVILNGGPFPESLAVQQLDRKTGILSRSEFPVVPVAAGVGLVTVALFLRTIL
jgi:hypothetical protein